MGDMEIMHVAWVRPGCGRHGDHARGLEESRLARDIGDHASSPGDIRLVSAGESGCVRMREVDGGMSAGDTVAGMDRQTGGRERGYAAGQNCMLEWIPRQRTLRGTASLPILETWTSLTRPRSAHQYWPSPDSRGRTEAPAPTAHLPPRRNLTSPRLIGHGLASGLRHAGHSPRPRRPVRMPAARAARTIAYPLADRL